MIEFKIISIEELENLIYLSYENDTDLIQPTFEKGMMDNT